MSVVPPEQTPFKEHFQGDQLPVDFFVSMYRLAGHACLRLSGGGQVLINCKHIPCAFIGESCDSRWGTRAARFSTLTLTTGCSGPDQFDDVTSNLTFPDFLKAGRNGAALRLRNSLPALATLLVIISLSSAPPSIPCGHLVLLSRMPTPAPPKLRPGSGSRISLVDNISHIGVYLEFG